MTTLRLDNQPFHTLPEVHSATKAVILHSGENHDLSIKLKRLLSDSFHAGEVSKDHPVTIEGDERELLVDALADVVMKHHPATPGEDWERAQATELYMKLGRRTP